MSQLFEKIQKAIKDSPEVRELKNDVVMQLKAEALRKAADELSGFQETQIVERDGIIFIELSARQKKALEEKIYRGLTSDEPGPIRAPYTEIIAPAVLRAYGRQAALAAVAIFFFGRLTK